MFNRITLSEGSLDIILEKRNEHLRPLVQILGSKEMVNNKIRVVISDGRTICQHCILISEDHLNQFKQGLLNKFTVIRLEQYNISSLTKKDNIPVLLVSQFTIIKNSCEINRRLTSNDFIETEESNYNTITQGTSMVISPTKQTIKNNFIEPSPLAQMPKLACKSNFNITPENICPINVLTPYFNSWIIRALVLNKSSLRTYNNNRGDGKVFSFEVCDDSGEIHIICFNEECGRFFDLIQKDKVYFIGKGNVKIANKKFSTVNNDYEIVLTPFSFVKICNDVQIEVPKTHYKFVKILDILNLQSGTIIDIIGIIRSVSEIETIISRKNLKELSKREIIIVDKSLAEARLTLWSDQAKDFKGQPNQVISLKGVIVGEFKGKTLSARDTTLINIDPDLPETHLFQSWYQTLDTNQDFMTLSKLADSISLPQKDFCYIRQINNKKLPSGGSLYFNNFSTIRGFNRSVNHLYKSCGYNNCQKKVFDHENGLYHCSKCDRTSPTFTWRLLISFLLSDVSGSFWATAFQDHIIKMINRSVEDLARMFEENYDEYMNTINELRFKSFNLRICSRLDTYNNETRIKNTVMQVIPITSANDRAHSLMHCIDILGKQVSA